MYKIDELMQIVNSYIENNPYNRQPQNLYAPVNYILSLGGKRVRPVLMLMAYNLYKEDVCGIIDQAVALETYHNFTLLHDDLMDKSDLRRGNQTVHKKWDENTAILSGDTMLILAYRLFSAGLKTNPNADRALSAFVEATLGVCDGQQYDMDFEKRTDVTEAEYMEMIRLKTSLLLASALQIGALLAGADDADVANLYDFGEKMGLAFQLQDDLLDVYGDPAVFKKKLGGDIVENKKTFMLINALQMATPEQKRVLQTWIEAPEFDADSKIAEVTAIYNAIGIKELAQKRIEELFSQSLRSLEQVNLPAERKQQLRLFADRLLDRKY